MWQLQQSKCWVCSHASSHYHSLFNNAEHLESYQFGRECLYVEKKPCLSNKNSHLALSHLLPQHEMALDFGRGGGEGRSENFS